LQATKLEVKAHEDYLQGKALDTLFKITINLVIEEYVRDKSLNLTHNYNKNQLACKIAHHYIRSINDSTYNCLYFDFNAKYKEAINKIINSESTDTSNFNATASKDDKKVATKVKATLTELFPKLTIDLCLAAKKCDLLHHIHAEKALFNKKNMIETATKEAAKLVTKDPVIFQSQLKPAVTAVFKKEFHTSKAHAHKNLLWTPKIRG
jgi:hypothetical protein